MREVNLRCAHSQPRAAVVARAAPRAARRALLLGLLPWAAGSQAQAEPEAFLKSSGARGFLADGEESFLALRKEREIEARAELDRERRTYEEAARQSQRGLCATPFGIDIVGITELLFLVGALAGGVAARQRKAEVERLNEQLRKINLQLRQQARAGTMYAPGLSYAPVSPGSASSRAVGSPTDAAPAAQDTGAAAPAAGAVAAPPAATLTLSPNALSSTDEEQTPEQLRCRDTLREGKRLLRNNQGGAALVRFEKALLMSKAVNDLVLQRRALRGMAASCRMQDNRMSAIKHLKAVLAVSEQLKEYTGDADAYGSIADIYADMGEFEKAAHYYDSYINKMQEDGQAV